MKKQIERVEPPLGKRIMKSKSVTLGLLSTIALAYSACNSAPEPRPSTPYDEYNYYGHAGEPGMVYSHYAAGQYKWFLLSRMFNGYGYYPPTFRPSYFPGRFADSNSHSRNRGGRFYGGSYYRGYYGTSTASTEGLSSGAHIAHGGFGSTGYGRGGIGA